MRRLMRLMLHTALVVLAAVVSFVVVDVAIAPGNGPGAMVNGLMAGAIGLLLGLFVAWLRGFPWRLIPVALTLSLRKAQDEFWWMATGLGAICVLIYY